MGDILLSWRNVWRNPRRSVLTILAIAFASSILVFMFSFQLGTYEDMINASVKLSSGHMQVLAEDYNDKNKVRMVVKDVDRISNILRNNEHVKAVTKRGEAFVLAQGEERTRGVMLLGIDISSEGDVSAIDERIIEGGYIGSQGAGDVIVGSLLAERLKLKLGSEVTLLGQGRDGSVSAALMTVVGIFDTGFEDYDRNVMMMDYNEFDPLFYMDGSAHRIVVMADSSESIENITNDLNSSFIMDDLEVLSWDELQPGLKQSIEMDLISGFVMYAILIIVVSFSILNTFLMAVFERTKEFGVLLSLGTSPARLIKVMLTESMFIAFVGLIFGIAAGAGVTLYYADVGISMQGSELMKEYGLSGSLYPKLSAISVLLGPSVIALVTFFAALYPALRITKLKPSDAVRAV